MSLISDTDYLIHNLRLNYLRQIDDPYGARLISLDPTYPSNPYIVAAGLADTDRWPELAAPTSPTPSDDESAPAARRRHSGFPGANLKYTTTILGPSRTGALGLRVNGKRTSMPRNSVRLSLRNGTKGVDATTSAVPTEETPITTEVIAATPTNSSPTKQGALRSPVKESPGPSPAQQQNGNGIPNGAGAPAQEGVRQMPVFVPKFRGAEQMEARRRMRLMARAQPPGMPPRPPVPAQNLNPEISSSEEEAESSEEEIIPDKDEEEFEMSGEADNSMELNDDEFDPEFAAGRGAGMHSDSASEGASILSGTNSMMSVNSSIMASSVPPSSSARASRLSPVREGLHGEERERPSVSPDARSDSQHIDEMFEMVTPAPKSEDDSGATEHPPANGASASSAPARKPSAGALAAGTPPGMFERKPVPPPRPAKSALTAMLAATSNTSSSNPFAELYSAISGRAESESMVVRVFFPMARKPEGQALELNVRKDATVEEVLGYALWTYWEEGWLPKIDEGLSGEEDPKWAIKCSAVGWILRIAEEDGEVDEDFPPPDRTSKISRFNFDAYAVLEATPSQMQQNKILESKIQRRISRVVVKKKSTGLLNAPANVSNNLLPPADTLLGTSAGLGSLGSSVSMFPSSLGPSSSHGPPLFLRIRIANAADEPGHISTTIQASGGMYMAEVLEAVCQKRKIENAKDYALVVEVGDIKMNIPLDRTVRSLQGKRELILMKKNMLSEYGVEVRERKGTTDPNASIFTTDVATQEQSLSKMFEYMNAYRKYTVYRKVPMLVARNARILAIDGGYIHIIPTVTKAKHVFDSGKTSSYHLKSVVTCSQSNKNNATFKLIVHSGAESSKRYEFEAESPKLAAEIVSTIRALKSAMEKPGGGKASRRNTRIGTTARPMGV
ncbi:stress-activated map kinase interacting protein 1-domain-containing protein [Trametes polyzona]|nr:stress-activated map kinase interacting protein 1-domain-containing protein [Trametes polyzona]